MVYSKDSHSSCHKRDDEIFIQWIPLSKNCKMQEHHRQKLAGFGENKGDVVDVRKGGISKRRC